MGKKAQLKQTRSSLLACWPRQAPLQQRGPVRKGLRPAPLSPGASSQWRPCPQPGRAAGWHRVPRDGAFPGPADNLGPVPFPPGEKLSPREGGRGCRVFGGIQLPPLQGGPDWSHWDVIYSLPRAAGGARDELCGRNSTSFTGLCHHGLESQSLMFGRNFEIKTWPCHLILQKGN